MAFVKFTDVGKSFVARASISTNGMISFTDGARKKFKIDDYKFCVLYFDKEDGRVGIELINDESEEGAIKLRFRQTGADVGAKSFLSCFNIVPSVTIMVNTEEGKKENWVILDLKTARNRKVKVKN